ncbi:Arv1-like protein [Westerdykella ornata]|uniref:Protein ARV n=1 Tax=Westerdykella ornata TaxID=318751 RepID=A0A6A6J4V6_WESOR|nr:Arv1-like protein [Westerdykella ornata]KAF2271475.1 Arv1-like protein [Westerdykella ornata]
MPTCIECRYPVKTLYTEYSKADDRALGKGVRLTQCPRCKRFADKYVEHDFVVLFIDLVLIKPQVYRHLLFNALGREDGKFDRHILRLGLFLLLFDVYLTWVRIEQFPLPPNHPSHHSTHSSNPPTNVLLLQAQPLLTQYLFFLLLVCASTAAFHLPICFLCSAKLGVNPKGHVGLWKRLYRFLVPYYPHPAPLSTALIVSSCSKLFPIVLKIWDYDLPSAATAVSWAVIVNNIAALEILMDCGYLRAAFLVAVGAGFRSLVALLMLKAAGLGTGWEGGLWESLWRKWRI